VSRDRLALPREGARLRCLDLDVGQPFAGKIGLKVFQFYDEFRGETFGRLPVAAANRD
jgi:hypothetical protein